ncbi:MAG: dienelactone hydrolase family protein [Candidatus Obscuribacterales bacterium]|nr:dienelactone hydrolase family protein [Candidatus Obscuribacterales bacterium]
MSRFQFNASYGYNYSVQKAARLIVHKLMTVCVLLIFFALNPVVNLQVQAQEILRQKIKERLRGRGQETRYQVTDTQDSPIKIDMAGLQVACWMPKNSKAPLPLVIFSHGFHGINTQSSFLMKALADAGYLVLAPNHKDALGEAQSMQAGQAKFQEASLWTENSYRDRANDLKTLIDYLKNDKYWKNRIDWSKVALAGHSLGGYTALGLAGAWPAWKVPGIKAVLALSPYCQPLVLKGELDKLKIPVMYQFGTRDFGIAPFIKREGGAFSKTSSPALMLEFENAGHFAWSNLNKNKVQENLISRYCIDFLNKFLLERKEVEILKRPGIAELIVK